MNAEFTNAITNLVHFGALSYYTLHGLWYCKTGNPNWRLSIVSLFFLFGVAKALGVIVHIPLENWPSWLPIFFFEERVLLWDLISIQVFMVSVVVVYLMPIPKNLGRVYIGVSLLFSLLFIFKQKFIILLIPQFMGLLLCMKYTIDWLKIGWTGILLSNLAWVILRYGLLIGAMGLEGAELSKYKYDNDIYHFMLIASTFYLFKSVNRGLWPQRGGI